MKQTIEEIQKMPHGEICTALTAIAPRVLEARAHFEALLAQQRLYAAARDLNSAGLCIGDKVQLQGQWAGKKNPQAIVVMPGAYLMFQVLKKDGEPHGEPQPEFMFQGFEKIAALPQ